MHKYNKSRITSSALNAKDIYEKPNTTEKSKKAPGRKRQLANEIG